MCQFPRNPKLIEFLVRACYAIAMRNVSLSVTTSEKPQVCCDGGMGALGHPLVYLKIGDSGDVVCPYCSRKFVLVAEE